MKYFLAVDKGFKSKERYELLDLKALEKDLAHNLMSNNNLKKLAVFTMSFDNEDDLKRFLTAKNILNKEDISKNLVFFYTWNRMTRTLLIPYRWQEKYFDEDFLAYKIKSNTNKSTKFLKDFLNRFQEVRYYSDSYYLLREATEIFLSDFILVDRIKDFIRNYCYKDGKLSYRRFYSLAMYVSEHDVFQKKHQKSDSLWNIDPETLDEAKRFKLEEWRDNVQKRKLERKTKD